MFRSTHLAVFDQLSIPGLSCTERTTDQFICALHTHVFRSAEGLRTAQDIGHHGSSEQCRRQAGRAPREPLGLADGILLFPSVSRTDKGNGCSDLVILFQDVTEVEDDRVLHQAFDAQLPIGDILVSNLRHWAMIADIEQLGRCEETWGMSTGTLPTSDIDPSYLLCIVM